MDQGDGQGARRRKVRLEDVAARTGVSVSTVSRALAGEKGVRAEIRERVAAAARALDYPLSMPVAGGRVIVAASGAAILDYMRNQFTVHVLEGLRERAVSLGIDMVTRPIDGQADLLATLDQARSDPETLGLLVLTLDEEAMLAPLRAFEKPVVLVNGDDPQMILSSVAPANRAAAGLAAAHLRDLGHERILFMLRPGRRTIERRREGWTDALSGRAAIPGPDTLLEVSDWLPELAADALRRRIGERGLDFTAILAAGDSLAIGAMTALAELGHAVPGAVSVMGMDDLPQSAFLDPPLTTIHIPMRRIGAAALDLLRTAIADPAMHPRRVELACRLVVRGSTGPAQKGKGAL